MIPDLHFYMKSVQESYLWFQIGENLNGDGKLLPLIFLFSFPCWDSMLAPWTRLVMDNSKSNSLLLLETEKKWCCWNWWNSKTEWICGIMMNSNLLLYLVWFAIGFGIVKVVLCDLWCLNVHIVLNNFWKKWELIQEF